MAICRGVVDIFVLTSNVAVRAVLGLWRWVMGASAFAKGINTPRPISKPRMNLDIMGVYLSIHIKTTPMMKIIAPATVNAPFNPKTGSAAIIARPVQFSFIPIIVD